MSPVLLNRLTLLLSYVGVFIAGVLSLAEIFDKDVPCGQAHGCAIVAAHPSSHLLGVPNAYIGFLGYIVLALLATYRELTGVYTNPKTITLGFILSAVGTVASAGLTLVSLTVIHATCVWCLSSAVTMTLLLLTYAGLAQSVTEERKTAPPLYGKASVVLVPALALLLVVGLGIQFSSMKEKTQGSMPIVVTPDQMTLLFGPKAHVKNPDGVISIAEFGDLVCPVCKRVYPDVEKMIDGSNGKIRFSFHHFPLFNNPEHVAALPGAAISEIAAEQGKFWNYVAACYGGDPQGPNLTQDNMLEIGKALGVDPDKASKRILDPNDPAFVRVQDDLDLAGKLGIQFTPTYIIFAPGLPARAVTGHRIIDLVEEPQYQAILKGK